jgi:GNAT superfamily N-acetyltransferase
MVGMAVRFAGSVVSADHPSLDDEVERFAARLHAERRYFGPSASANPKPPRSLIEGVRQRGHGISVAALVGNDVIGLARVDARGDVLVAVDAEHRGAGAGTAMCAELVRRARAAGVTRLVLRGSRRSHAVAALGRTMGCSVIDQGRGRVDLILHLVGVSDRSA